MSDLLRSPKGKIGLAVAGGILVVAAVWLLLVSPQRSKAAELGAEVDASRVELAQRRLAVAQPSSAVTVKPSDLYRLTKALPSETDMSSVLLEVSRAAERGGLALNSVAPSSQVSGTGYLQQPLEVVVQGRFAKVSRFVGDLQSLVSVRHGRLDARGRLYSVSRVDMSAPDGARFPIVKASVTLNAYSFSAPAPATTPDPSTTTDTSSSGTVAAGATP